MAIVDEFADLRDGADGDPDVEVELARATEDEKRGQLDRVRTFQDSHRDEGQAQLARLQDAATGGGNVFARGCSSSRASLTR